MREEVDALRTMGFDPVEVLISAAHHGARHCRSNSDISLDRWPPFMAADSYHGSTGASSRRSFSRGCAKPSPAPHSKWE